MQWGCQRGQSLWSNHGLPENTAMWSLNALTVSLVILEPLITFEAYKFGYVLYKLQHQSWALKHFLCRWMKVKKELPLYLARVKMFLQLLLY